MHLNLYKSNITTDTTDLTVFCTRSGTTSDLTPPVIAAVSFRKDFFSKFDETGDGQIDADELMKGARTDGPLLDCLDVSQQNNTLNTEY